MTNKPELTDERISNATLIRLIKWAEQHNSHYVEAALRELQERRKADSAEPVSFDELNAAVAEVTGGNQHAWNSGIYKGHQAVPFMNYNSLARIVDKYRAPQPVPVVPDEKTDRDYVTDCHGLPSIEDCGHQRGWNACRAAMLQAGNYPVTPDTWILVSERMPERDVDVQVYCADKKEQMVGYMERNEADGWFRFASLPNGGGVYCKPTHWMPLPAAPQQGVK